MPRLGGGRTKNHPKNTPTTTTSCPHINTASWSIMYTSNKAAYTVKNSLPQMSLMVRPILFYYYWYNCVLLRVLCFFFGILLLQKHTFISTACLHFLPWRRCFPSGINKPSSYLLLRGIRIQRKQRILKVTCYTTTWFIHWKSRAWMRVPYGTSVRWFTYFLMEKSANRRQGRWTATSGTYTGKYQRIENAGEDVVALVVKPLY